MEDAKLLTEIIPFDYSGRNLTLWPFWSIEKFPDVRIYYRLMAKKGEGFDFYAVERLATILNPEGPDNEWNEEGCLVECIVQGTAYFDGLRHLYYGDQNTGNYGYHHYPDLEQLSAVFSLLRNFEKKHCREHE